MAGWHGEKTARRPLVNATSILASLITGQRALKLSCDAKFNVVRTSVHIPYAREDKRVCVVVYPCLSSKKAAKGGGEGGEGGGGVEGVEGGDEGGKGSEGGRGGETARGVAAKQREDVSVKRTPQWVV